MIYKERYGAVRVEINHLRHNFYVTITVPVKSHHFIFSDFGTVNALNNKHKFVIVRYGKTKYNVRYYFKYRIALSMYKYTFNDAIEMGKIIEFNLTTAKRCIDKRMSSIDKIIADIYEKTLMCHLKIIYNKVKKSKRSSDYDDVAPYVEIDTFSKLIRTININKCFVNEFKNVLAENDIESNVESNLIIKYSEQYHVYLIERVPVEETC